MTKDELVARLRSEGIRDDAYDLGGGHEHDRYALGESYGNWFFYYSERGMEIGRKEFNNESDACTYLLMRILRDPTTRKRRL